MNLNSLIRGTPDAQQFPTWISTGGNAWFPVKTCHARVPGRSVSWTILDLKPFRGWLFPFRIILEGLKGGDSGFSAPTWGS